MMAHQSLTVDLEGAIRERMVVRRVPLDTDDNWWYIEYLGCEHIHGEGQVCMVVLTEDQRNMLLLERTWGEAWKMLEDVVEILAFEGRMKAGKVFFPVRVVRPDEWAGIVCLPRYDD